MARHSKQARRMRAVACQRSLHALDEVSLIDPRPLPGVPGISVRFPRERCQRRVSLRTDDSPARIHRAHLEIDMEDVPLTLADLIGAIVIGLALGALISFGI